MDERPDFFGGNPPMGRFHSDLAMALDRTWIGADRIDAERHRMVARALRRLHFGDPIETVLATYHSEWKSFQTMMNRKIVEAPKIAHGPCSGRSVISHRFATDSNGNQGSLDIERHHHAAQRVRIEWEEKWGEI